jgi:hypothetical protein
MRNALDLRSDSGDNGFGLPPVDTARSNTRLLGFLQSNPMGGTEQDALEWAMQHVPLGTGATSVPAGTTPGVNMMPIPQAPASAASDSAPSATVGYDNDPVVKKLLAQASDAVNNHNVPKDVAQAMLVKQLAALGYKPQAVPGGG